MIGQRLSHFKIVEKIGEGGMGIVYKALDEKLGRNVVLKVLQPDAVGDENRRLRFMREARAAAAVTHPHIATIHEIDEADGQIFIAMELVEGKTLDRHLGSSPAAPRDGLRIAIEVAEALARAHRAGVVHRDLKPQNIIVGSDGHAKVLDFGLAKLLDDERLQDAAEATTMQTVSAEMTRDGKVLGTATYMSPEQARGLPVDTRSDLFSFGTLLYEMFTGRLPFRGATITDTLSAILRDTPEPVAQLNPEMSTELQRIIEKCLEKDAKDRYQHADDIVVDLRRLRRETDSVPVSRVESGPLSAATGRMNRAASPAWRRPATLLGGLALLAVAVIAVVGLTGRDGLIPSSKADATGLAVMPFRNLKDRDDTQRMGQILQELIITDLSGLESVTVYSSQRLQDILKQVGAGKDGAIDTDTITRVARDAGARRMLTGSLSQLGSDWTLTSQLIDVRDGSVLKSERIDGADLYSMVDELTSRLRAELGVAATAVTDSVKDKTTDSMEAYEAYLAGVDRLNANRYDEAVEHFERAVEIDPRFGQALYKLAVARWWADDAQSADPDIGARTLELALAANVKLPERGRRLAEAFLPLLKRDYAEAVPGFERLVEQYPDEKEAWYGLGEARWHSPGGSEKLASIEPFQKALDLDPSFHLVYGHMETTYTRLDMQDQAIAQVRELIDQNPDDPAWYREWIGWLARKGDLIALEGAIDEAFDHVPDLPARRRMLHVAGNLIEDPDGRETFYRRALDVPTDTDQHRTYVSLGWLYFNEKFDERAAERAFSSALDLVPTHEPALWGVYQVLRAEGRLDEVVLKSRALLARDPELETALVLWIKAAILKGDEDETVRAVGQALGESPDGNRRKWVWRNVVESYLEIGDVSRAAESAAELRTTDSGESDDPLRPLLARIEIERRNYREAGRLLEPERLAENFAARWAMMRLAIRQKNFDDAIRAADWFNKRQTGSYRVSAWLRPRILAGRYDEADRLLESELEATDSEALRRAILIHVADIYADAGEFTRAARLAERAGSLRGQPTDWSLPLLQARLSMRNRRYDDAAERLAKVTAVHPRLSWVLWHVEWNEMMRGNAAVAERMVRDRLARGPASKSAYDELALALAAQGKFREALEPAEKSLAMNADRDSYAVLAWVLVAGELDVDRGIAMAEAGCAIDADVEEQGRFAAMPSPEHALGLGLLKQGRKSEAARVLEEAARLRPQRTLIQEHLAEAR